MRPQWVLNKALAHPTDLKVAPLRQVRALVLKPRG